jgi:hypothetical protein
LRKKLLYKQHLREEICVGSWSVSWRCVH